MTDSINARPSKTKRLMSMFKPINHCIIHHYQKEKKSFLRRKKASEGPLRLLFRFHSDRVFVRFFSDRVHLRVLSDRVLFESSVIDSSLGSSVLFFRHTAIRCHLLSFVIPLVVTRCHLSLVLTRCTTRLPF